MYDMKSEKFTSLLPNEFAVLFMGEEMNAWNNVKIGFRIFACIFSLVFVFVSVWGVLFCGLLINSEDIVHDFMCVCAFFIRILFLSVLGLSLLVL